MPNRIMHLLYSWGEVGVGAADRDRWRIVQTVFGGLFGKKEMMFWEQELWSPKDQTKLYQTFLCKQIYLEDTEYIIDILGSC